MFLLRKPSDLQIRAFITAQQQSDFSYSPVGITRNAAVAGYTMDHNRVQLGSGANCFDAAIAAIREWKTFDLGWVHLFSSETPIEKGATVAVVINHLGFWSMNACRIAYVVEDHGADGAIWFCLWDPCGTCRTRRREIHCRMEPGRRHCLVRHTGVVKTRTNGHARVSVYSTVTEKICTRFEGSYETSGR